MSPNWRARLWPTAALIQHRITQHFNTQTTPSHSTTQQHTNNKHILTLSQRHTRTTHECTACSPSCFPCSLPSPSFQPPSSFPPAVLSFRLLLPLPSVHLVPPTTPSHSTTQQHTQQNTYSPCQSVTDTPPSPFLRSFLSLSVSISPHLRAPSLTRGEESPKLSGHHHPQKCCPLHVANFPRARSEFRRVPTAFGFQKLVQRTTHKNASRNLLRDTTFESGAPWRAPFCLVVPTTWWAPWTI